MREEGQSMAEYAVVLLLVALVAVLALTHLGQAVLAPLQHLFQGF